MILWFINRFNSYSFSFLFTTLQVFFPCWKFHKINSLSLDKYTFASMKSSQYHQKFSREYIQFIYIYFLGDVWRKMKHDSLVFPLRIVGKLLFQIFQKKTKSKKASHNFFASCCSKNSFEWCSSLSTLFRICMDGLNILACFFLLFLILRVRTFTYIIRDDEGQKRGAPAPAIGDEDWRAVLNTRWMQTKY